MGDRLGDQLDVAMADYKTRRTQYLKAVEELKMAQDFSKKLKRAHENRVTRWHIFRDYMITRVKAWFHSNLARRGYTGRLKFDTKESVIELRVSFSYFYLGTRSWI